MAKRRFQEYWELINSTNKRANTKEKLYRNILSTRSRWKKEYDGDVDLLLMSAIGSPCPYCLKKLEIGDLSLDHQTPKSIGGTVVEVVCKRCNRMKGELTKDEYITLLELIGTIERPKARQYIKRKLAYLDGAWRK